MRANEFIAEHKKVGDLSTRNQQATVGLHKFRDAEFADRVYELNRIMMAVASNDGKEFVQDMDAESWVGRHDVAAPYTKEEADMLKKAYQVVGSKHYDLNRGDLDSEEHPAVNNVSPIKGFRGY
jgi:hypothetical protein